MNDIVIAIDIGNTNTSIGVVDINKLICIKKETFKSKDSVSNVVGFLKQYYSDLKRDNLIKVNVCSVIPIPVGIAKDTASFGI